MHLARARAGSETDAAGHRASALDEFKQELAIDPTNANAAYEAGEIHRQAGRLDEARTFFEAAVSHYPEFEQALVALGRVLVALKTPAAAVPLLEKATTLDPRDEVGFYQLSLAHRALGNAAAQQKALAEYQRLRDEQSKVREPIARLRLTWSSPARRSDVLTLGPPWWRRASARPTRAGRPEGLRHRTTRVNSGPKAGYSWSQDWRAQAAARSSSSSRSRALRVSEAARSNSARASSNAAELHEQVAAHARQQVIALRASARPTSASTISRPAAGPTAIDDGDRAIQLDDRATA